MSEASLEKLFRAEIEGVRTIALDAKQIAIKRHTCVKEDVINSFSESVRELRGGHLQVVKELEHWKFFKRLFFIMVSVVVGAVVTTAIAFSKNSYDTKIQSQEMASNLKSVTKSQDQLEQDISHIKSDIKERDTVLTSEEQYERLKQVVVEALEVKNSKRAKNKRE